MTDYHSTTKKGLGIEGEFRDPYTRLHNVVIMLQSTTAIQGMLHERIEKGWVTYVICGLEGGVPGKPEVVI